MREKAPKREQDSNLPVIFRSPDYAVISNGELQTTLTSDMLKGMFRFFESHPNQPISKTYVAERARHLGSKAKYPEESATDSLRSALSRIDRGDCLQSFYGTEYQFKAKIQILENLVPPVSIPRKPRN